MNLKDTVLCEILYGITYSWSVLVTQSCQTLCNPMDHIAHQALLFMEFSRQEYCSGLSLPSPRDLPSPGIKAWSPTLQTDFFFTI